MKCLDNFYHPLCVACCVSCVTCKCHLSPVPFHDTYVTCGGASRWRICYQQGYPSIFFGFIISFSFWFKFTLSVSSSLWHISWRFWVLRFWWFFPFFKKIGFLGILGPPSYGICATIRIGREMLCLQYAGFFLQILFLLELLLLWLLIHCSLPAENLGHVTFFIDIFSIIQVNLLWVYIVQQ